MSNFISIILNRFDEHMLDVIKGTFQSFVMRVLGAALGFAVSISIGRLLGVEDAGVYFLALSVAAIATAFGKLGFDFTSVRFIAALNYKKDMGGIRGIYTSINNAVLVSSIIVGVIICTFALWIMEETLLKQELIVPLILVGICITPLSLLTIQANALRGLRKIPESEWFKTGFIPFVTLLFLIPFTNWWGVNGAVAAYALSTIIVFLAVASYWAHCLKGHSGNYKPVSKAELFASSWPSLVVTISAVVITQTPFIFLSLWGSNQDLGLYGAANRISALLLFPLMAAISILAPKFSMLFHSDEHVSLEQMAQRSSILLTAIGLPLVVIVFFCSEWILSFFGEGFILGVDVLHILLIGAFLNMATGAIGELLMMTGNEKSARNAHIIAALIVISGCIIFIPLYGLVGAAWSVNLGIIIQNLLMIFMVKKQLNFWPLGIGIK
ncbi:MAG: flippase [Bacteroidetes bacterium]|nr:flippase [Bacteroidota bacterium]